MKISEGTILHIISLALKREENKISHDENVELYDSIDCLSMDELLELYMYIESGKPENRLSETELSEYAKSKGFTLSGAIFNNLQLGSLLSNGYKKASIGNI